MTKNSKKIISISLVFALLLSMFCISVVGASAARSPAASGGTLILADVDGNGTVALKDATMIQKHLAKLAGSILAGDQLIVADIDGDGIVNLKDVTLIQKWLAKMTIPYDVGQPIQQSTTQPESTTAPVSTVEPTTVPVETRVIYFDNTQTAWSEVALYEWSNGVAIHEMTPVEGAANIFCLTIPVTVTAGLFKNTINAAVWDKQTTDVAIPTDGKNIFVPLSTDDEGKYTGEWRIYPYVDEPTEEPSTEEPSTEEPTEEPTTVPSETRVIYFDNTFTGWSTVALYEWSNGVAVHEMTAVEGAANIYCLTIPVTVTAGLFKNSNSTADWDKQTTDIAIPTDGKNIFVPLATDDQGKYTGEWRTYPYVDEPTEEPTTEEPTVAEPTTAEGTTQPSTELPPVADGMQRIFFDNTYGNWTAIHLYKWNPTPTTNTLMIHVEGNIYYLDIPDTVTQCLFKQQSVIGEWSNSLQTVNVTIPTDGKNCYQPTARNSDSKLTGAWVTYPFAPQPTTGPEPTVEPTTVPVSSEEPTEEPTTADEPTTEGTTQIIYFDNTLTGWSEVVLYEWSNGVALHPMTLVDGTTNIYTVSISTSVTAGLLKNLNSTADWDLQTGDITIPTDGKNIFVPLATDEQGKYTGEWRTYPYVDEPTEEPTAEEPTEEPTTEEPTAEEPTEEPTTEEATTEEPTSDQSTTEEPTTQEATAVIYLKDSAGWIGDASAEIYASDGTTGILMTKLNAIVWTASVPASWLTSLNFYRCNPAVTPGIFAPAKVWNTWAAGAADTNNKYTVTANAVGTWGIYDPVTDVPLTGNTTIYFDNTAAQWTAVYFYPFSGGTVTALTRIGTSDIWQAEVPSAQAAGGFLFKDTASTWVNQTKDIAGGIPAGKNCLAPTAKDPDASNKWSYNWSTYTPAP